MSSMFDRFAGAVTGRPATALVALGVVTIGLSAGVPLLADQADNSAFLPDDSDVSVATETLSEEFPDSAGLTTVTILHRGDVLTPEGLAHVDEVVTEVVDDPEVAERLALSNAVVSIADVYQQALQGADLATVTQDQIDSVTETLAADPEQSRVLDALIGEADGESLAISSVSLRQLGDPDGLAATELQIADVVTEVDGPLEVRSLSPETVDAESAEASQSSMTTLALVAAGVIVLLLFVFYRTATDVVFSILGLAVTVVGTLGFQGLLGPNGLDVIGAPSRITTLVPIILIALVVDYAIQAVARYREQRADGHAVAPASRTALAIVALPLVLAGGTTIISFVTNVASPIPATRDFGVVAAFGVFFGLVAMLTLVPAARALMDRRREQGGSLATPRPIADAIPGAGGVIRGVGSFVARKPAIVLVGTTLVTVVLGASALRITTEFNSDDFLPTGGESLTDLDALDEAFGGQTEPVTALVEAELTDDRTVLNLLEITQSFDDEATRPTGAAGPITLSLGSLLLDWTDDSGEPGDKFDAELVEIAQGIDQGLTLDPAGIQDLLDRLAVVDPEGLAQVAVVDPDGPDLALVQYDAFTGDQDRTEQMVDDVEGLWFGDDDQITLTSGDVLALVVTEAMAETQTVTIAITVISALIVLMLFFGITLVKPMLSVIAVLPIVLVLLWVLGVMSFVGIPYNVVTALITALSIGIGVDYTIHVIHRFTEELEHTGSVESATTETLSTTGSALLGSALTTVLGFGVLAFSPLVPFQQFGLVTALTILFSLIAAIVVVPPMLVVWAAYQQWQLASQGRFVARPQGSGQPDPEPDAAAERRPPVDAVDAQPV